jgi:amidase
MAFGQHQAGKGHPSTRYCPQTNGYEISNSSRLPYSGMANSMEGQNSILSVVGPLATSVGALRLVTKSVLSQQPWLYDPLVNELPWRDEQEQAILNIAKSGKGGQLAFGIMRSDGNIYPQPPVRRAMEIVVKTIEKLGHKAIEWKPPSHQRCLELAVSCPPKLL